jgi:uncharacterized protein YndB with AHSA1/START domain
MSTDVGVEQEARIAGKHQSGLTVAVSRVVPASVDHVWEVLVSPPGTAALLGEGAVLAGKGEHYYCADGVSGVLRSFHPLEQIRVSFHQTPESPPSIVEVDLRSDGETTVIDLRHERISDEALCSELEQRWKTGLEAFSVVAAG